MHPSYVVMDLLIFLQESEKLVHRSKSNAGDSIRAALVNGDFSAFRVCQAGAGKRYIWNIPYAFVSGLGRKQIGLWTAQHLPRLFQVQQGYAKAVDKSVAAGQDAVIEEEPSLVGLNGNGACADLCGAPGAIERGHDVTVTAPISEIGTFTIENLPKGGVAVVAGTGEHGVVSVYFSGEQYAIAVAGQKGIFNLVKIF